MTDDFLKYDQLVEQALKGVVRTALRAVQEHGLPGSHHFYITFLTQYPGVQIPSYLREKYTEEMTIVLQYQFYNLEVTEEKFSVGLSFNNIQENLEIPFAAISGFADPSVKFGLQFHSEMLLDDDDEEALEAELADILALSETELSVDTADSPPPKTPNGKGKSKANGNVVSLDKFRKK